MRRTGFGADAPNDGDGFDMATDDDVPMNPEYMDYAEHERTFRGFMFVTKWGVLAVAIILVVLVGYIL